MLNINMWIIICLITSRLISGRPIKEITETRDTAEMQIPAVFSHPNGDTLKPSEIQKAVCTVTSGDVRASAEAFTTRELKGVCSSSELFKAINDLENKLSRKLHNIQIILNDLNQKHLIQNAIEKHLNESSEEPVTSAGSSYAATPPSSLKFLPLPEENKQQPKADELNKDYYLTPKLKSLKNKDENTKALLSQREKKNSRYNNTLITNTDVKVYTYYWRVENFTRSIKSSKSFSMESPLFSIRGKAFRIKAHFQHLHRDYLYLQLEDFSSAAQLSLGNSIILDTGGIFKEITSESFKYKMSILDQNKNRSSDLVSQEFDNYETGFSIPNSALIDSPFIKEDSLLIQLFLYL